MALCLQTAHLLAVRYYYTATFKKMPNNHPAMKLLMSVKIMRPDRQVAVQGLLQW